MTVAPIDLQFLGAPAEVRDRSVLPACGVERVGQGEPFNVAARQCFWDAYIGGEPAEFITTRPTADGRALVTIFRTLGGEGVELFVDETAIWGRPTWTWTACDELTPTTDPSVPIDWIPGTPETACEQQRLGDQP